MNLSKMKITAALALTMSMAASVSQAGVWPEALQLKGYDVTANGSRLSVYAVHCSNRTEPLISSVEGVRQWCAEGQCFRDKIDAAQAACENSQRDRVAQRK